MYLAPACSLWLLLGIALVEWPRMAAEGALGLIAAKPLLYMSAAAMGFGVNSLAYIVIQLASSLTLKVPASETTLAHLCNRDTELVDRVVRALIRLWLCCVASGMYLLHVLSDCPRSRTW